LPAQITLDPYPLYLAAFLGKLGTTGWRCDKPAGRAAVVGSLLIALLAMPEFICRTRNGSACSRYRWGCFRSQTRRPGRRKVKNGLTSLLAIAGGSLMPTLEYI
jgi:hypothetical protein